MLGSYGVYKGGVNGGVGFSVKLGSGGPKLFAEARYNYLAKSTPELILDRLVRSTKGPEREFYARLLAKFK